jgi:hypothetical protein
MTKAFIVEKPLIKEEMTVAKGEKTINGLPVIDLSIINKYKQEAKEKQARRHPMMKFA